MIDLEAVNSKKPKAGFLGVLNGLIGIDKNHYGAICAQFDDNTNELTGFGLTNTEKVTKTIQDRKKLDKTK